MYNICIQRVSCTLHQLQILFVAFPRIQPQPILVHYSSLRSTSTPFYLQPLFKYNATLLAPLCFLSSSSTACRLAVALALQGAPRQYPDPVMSCSTSERNLIFAIHNIITFFIIIFKPKGESWRKWLM